MRQINLAPDQNQAEVVSLLLDNSNNIVRLTFINDQGSNTTLHRPRVHYFNCGNRTFRLYAPEPFNIFWQDITEVHLNN